jgi:sigma-B regulation protein RsbU (phosphoserine phosphatase)
VVRAHRWSVIACAYFVLVLVVDLVSRTNQDFTGLFALIPVLLALEWGPRIVLLASIPLVALSATRVGFFDSEPANSTVMRTLGVAIGVGVGVYLAFYRKRRDTTLANSRAAVLATQEAILPVVPSVIGRLRFACAYRAAANESHIGGDFYKVVDTDCGTRLVLGDVRGKGLSAIAMTAAVLGAFREWAPETATLKSLVARLDARVLDRAHRGDFVTGVLASVDSELTLEVANCGHPSPMLIKRGTSGQPIDPGRRSPPLGLGPDPDVNKVHLEPGDRILFYTDGLIECRDVDGEWIELDDRLLADIGKASLDTALGGLLGRLEQRAGVLDDDIALLLLEVGN